MEKIFYYASVFETFRIIAGLILAIGLIAFIGFFIYAIDEYVHYGKNEDLSFFIKADALCLLIVLFSSLIVVFIPSRETYLLMKGGKVVDTAINNNEDLKNIPENTLNLLNEYIKTVTEELSEENNEQ